jgi:hypothetical protein
LMRFPAAFLSWRSRVKASSPWLPIERPSKDRCVTSECFKPLQILMTSSGPSRGHWTMSSFRNLGDLRSASISWGMCWLDTSECDIRHDFNWTFTSPLHVLSMYSVAALCTSAMINIGWFVLR